MKVKRWRKLDDGLSLVVPNGVARFKAIDVYIACLQLHDHRVYLCSAIIYQLINDNDYITKITKIVVNRFSKYDSNSIFFF